MSNKAVVLLSGGLDSSTCAFIAKDLGYDLYCLTIHYKQRHLRELKAAHDIATAVRAKEHHLIKAPLPWKGSALTDTEIQVPRDGVQEGVIPVTYVPARNMVFLAFAASYAEVVGAKIIFAGMNSIDYSGYPDCRPEFINAFEDVIRLGTKVGVEGSSIGISTPLIYKTKAEIIQYGLELGVPYELTWSCYSGESEPCHECDSCLLRERAWASLGMEDPLCQKN